MHVNFKSAVPKCEDHQLLLKQVLVQIIGVKETWLNNDDDNVLSIIVLIKHASFLARFLHVGWLKVFLEERKMTKLVSGRKPTISYSLIQLFSNFFGLRTFLL